MAEPREALSDVIADLESKGSLSGDDAARLRSAPVWWISAPEVLSYLGALIVATGLPPLVGNVIDELGLSKTTMAILLALSGALFGVISWKLISRSLPIERIANFLAVLAVGSLGSSAGFFAHELTPIHDASAGMVGAGLALFMGLTLMTRTRFAGTVITAVAGNVFLGVTCAAFDIPDDYWPLIFGAAGLALIELGTRKIGFSFGARFAGAVGSTGAVIAFASLYDTVVTPILSIAILSGVIAIGFSRRMMEVVIVYCLGLVPMAWILTSKVFPGNFLAQSLAVTACGLAVVIGSVTVVRRTRTAA